jgi:hypothetical protein
MNFGQSRLYSEHNRVAERFRTVYSGTKEGPNFNNVADISGAMITNSGCSIDVWGRLIGRIRGCLSFKCIHIYDSSLACGCVTCTHRTRAVTADLCVLNAVKRSETIRRMGASCRLLVRASLIALQYMHVCKIDVVSNFDNRSASLGWARQREYSTILDFSRDQLYSRAVAKGCT